jgi:flavin reductase (DIM6/NTAB) family NADH-FMN oxidoreductase RutF
LRARNRRYDAQVYHSTALHGFKASIGCSEGNEDITTENGLSSDNQESISRSRTTQELRSNMRSITYPVAIITSSDINIDSMGGPKSWRGATVSSFNTVSMYPTPIVSFNIHEKSSTLEAIRRSGFFAVHLLSRTPEAMDIATRFSKPLGDAHFQRQDLLLQPYVKDKSWSRIDGLFKKISLPPKLQWQTEEQPRAILSHILCQVSTTLDIKIEDHVVVFGEPKVVWSKERLDEEDTSLNRPVPQECLTYSNGRYNVDGESAIDTK